VDIPLFADVSRLHATLTRDFQTFRVAFRGRAMLGEKLGTGSRDHAFHVDQILHCQP
jgi:hypothetical protein